MSVTRLAYRLALCDADGGVIDGQYVYASYETPMPGLRLDLPGGTWFVHEVAATWSEERSSQLLGTDPQYGGALVCHSEPPQ
jgi:hypothetical protein